MVKETKVKSKEGILSVVLIMILNNYVFCHAGTADHSLINIFPTYVA